MPTLPLPAHGATWTDLRQRMAEAASGDLDWRSGRATRNAWVASPQVHHVAEEAFRLFQWDNGLYPSSFPSLKRFQEEAVAITAGLLGGGAESTGTLTTGGTESNFQACVAARERARRKGSVPAGRVPRIVAPRTAHPSFDKAAWYLGMEVVRVPVDEIGRADPAAMERAVDAATVMLVGSAPCWPYGCVDPIEDIAAVAAARGLWMHVDSCVGGFTLPFIRKLGREVPPFDLSVPGVDSMSADLHKYGFAAKGASVVLFRDEARKALTRFTFDDWPTGSYATEVFNGTRTGGAISAAWAVLHHLGEDGYLKLTGRMLAAFDRIKAAVDEIPSLGIFGRPHAAVLPVVGRGIDVFAVAEAMEARGWTVSRCKEPPIIHLLLNPLHADIADRYVDDLRAAVADVAAKSGAARSREVSYAG